MKYAVIKNGGHQYKVTVGQVLNVEKLNSESLPAQAGKTVTFGEVLLVVDGDQVELGMPTIDGMTVSAEVVSEVKGEKIEVFKYKSKSRYRKHTGHRQKYTQVKITAIGGKGAPSESKAKPKTVKAAKPADKKAPTKKPLAKKVKK